MINKADYYYVLNLQDILDNGVMDENPRPKYKDGTPAHSKFITQVFETYDISKGEFPIPTLRNTATKTGIREMFWIYQKQSSKLVDAHELGVNWWNEWNIGDGTIGMRYGATVKTHDLLNKLLKTLKEDPFSRRHVINLLQQTDLEATDGLYPCAFETIWSVRKVNGIMYLDMTLNQRSNDYLMAGYINKIQYVGLQMMIANTLGYMPGKFCHLVQNLHIYDRHLDSAKILFNRTSLEVQPKLILNAEPGKDFYEYTIADFSVTGTEDIPKLPNDLEIAV